jgi:hypothetical protein
MTRVRAIWTELVERRLWPVVAALLVALVAVPLLLSGGDNAATPAPVPGVSGVASNTQPATVVSLQATPSSKLRNRRGHSRDPFVQKHVPPAVSDTTGSTSSALGPSTSTGMDASPLDSNYGANPTSPITGTSPSTPYTATPTGSNVYHAVIRVKELGKVSFLHDAARYDYIPSDTQRDMLFLGVLADRKTAVFSMLKPGYFRTSGHCRPVRKFCVTMELRPGDSTLLTLPKADGTVRRVRITLMRIFARKVKQPARKASSSKARKADGTTSGRFLP